MQLLNENIQQTNAIQATQKSVIMQTKKLPKLLTKCTQAPEKSTSETQTVQLPQSSILCGNCV